MFDATNPADQKTFTAVMEVHEFFTTDEKLLEMLHWHNTQLNESLNMRLVELAPKHKNYSRTKSLDYKVAMVAGHHNLGMIAYYTSVFKELNLDMDDSLMAWFRKKDYMKDRKKLNDCRPEVKARRRFKFEAKLKEDLYKESTAGPKDGTYKSGVALAKDASNKKRKSKGKKRDFCDCKGMKPHKNKNSKFCLYGKNATMTRINIRT